MLVPEQSEVADGPVWTPAHERMLLLQLMAEVGLAGVFWFVGPRAPIVPLDGGLAAVAVAEAIIASARSGDTVTVRTAVATG